MPRLSVLASLALAVQGGLLAGLLAEGDECDASSLEHDNAVVKHDSFEEEEEEEEPGRDDAASKTPPNHDSFDDDDDGDDDDDDDEREAVRAILRTLPQAASVALISHARGEAWRNGEHAHARLNVLLRNVPLDGGSTMDLSFTSQLDGVTLTDALRLSGGCIEVLRITACPLITAGDLESILPVLAPRIRVLEVGGTSAELEAARKALPRLLPKLRRNTTQRRSTASWEELDDVDVVEEGRLNCLERVIICTDAPHSSPWMSSLDTVVETRRLVDSWYATTSANCASDADHAASCFLAPSDAQMRTTWQTLGIKPPSDPTFDIVSHESCGTEKSDATPVPFGAMAEKFRLAFVSRDARLAPKRAKDRRRNARRRLVSDILSSHAHHRLGGMSDVDAPIWRPGPGRQMRGLQVY